jgi:hypothetical protein
MSNSFEENVGRYPFVSLAQTKEYLSISSNTADARISNVIFYATGVIEHYIGQEILANDYVEIYDGGTSSVFTSRLPLSNVYSVTEFMGSDYELLNDTTTLGTPVPSISETVTFSAQNNAKVTTKAKKFGKSSLRLDEDDFITASRVTDGLSFDISPFTIESFIRVDNDVILDNVIFSINTDSTNYIEFSLANSNVLALTTVIGGATTTVLGNAVGVHSEATQFAKKQWAHVAVSVDTESERAYLHYNGNTLINSAYAVSNHTFSSNVVIGSNFKGFMDELRVSDISRYSSDFATPTQRFRPDNDTVMLVHFDGSNNTKNINDVHAQSAEYGYSKDTGEITKDTGRGVGQSYPGGISLRKPARFAAFASGVEVRYRAGYDASYVPFDIQLAALDYIKILYKQTQEKQGMSFEGESGDSFNLSGNFPPHIRRVLDLYRII